MTEDADIAAIHAETLAVQAVLIAVLRRLAAERDDLGPIICGALDDAERVMDAVTLRLGDSVPISSTVGVLRVIEQLRSAIIADESACAPQAD
ncbi:MAG: hypothetical protein ACK4K7_08825 [Allosphingosinicella sp.]|uniref:hypothetical protein n=1 Tax=Allosphingosinicella sp. TaxID=2823234 RepID=UPI003963AD94